jgi:hypothetical protein
MIASYNGTRVLETKTFSSSLKKRCSLLFAVVEVVGLAPGTL